ASVPISADSCLSASSSTRPCCAMTRRYCLMRSKVLRALSLPIVSSRHVDQDRRHPDRHVFLEFHEQAALLDGDLFAAVGAHLGAIVGAFGDRSVDGLEQLRVAGVAEGARDEELPLRRDLHA